MSDHNAEYGGGRIVAKAPPKPHRCSPPATIGIRIVRVPLAPFEKRPEGAQRTMELPVEPAHGTVWQCGCGRTFVAVPYRQRFQNAHVCQQSEWVREGRIARWRRERKADHNDREQTNE